jgi:hypothetical protein
MILPVTGEYIFLSLVLPIADLLNFTSDSLNAACHWYLLPVTCIVLPVTNVLEAISNFAVVSRYDQVVQRLSTTMKTVAKGILKDHLIPMASSMTCSGNLNGFNNAGYKVTFHPLKMQVPLTESTLFTPMKCLRSRREMPS